MLSMTTGQVQLVGVDRGLNAGYGPATRSHVAASLAVLKELAYLASTPSAPHSEVRHVRIGLFDHGWCLNPLLFGFSVRAGTGQVEIPPQAPRMPIPKPAHLVRSLETTPDTPLVYAAVANHPVDVQIQHTVLFLARLVARRPIAAGQIPTRARPDVDVLGSQLDAIADSEIADLLRGEGWRKAATVVRMRAEATGAPLSVVASGTLMTPEQISRQVPIARHIYNDAPRARAAIDLLATLLSQGLKTAGGENADVAGLVRDFLDVGLSRTYMAHVARDAYVCGNGYLSFGDVPDEDTRLLYPETVSIENEGIFVEHLPDRSVVHRKVLHIKGASQPDSPYGVSLLEPLVGLQLQRELADYLLETAAAWDSDDVPAGPRKDATDRVPFAQRTLAMVDQQTEEIFGPVTGANSLGVKVPSELYFRGSEIMQPAAQAILSLA